MQNVGDNKHDIRFTCTCTNGKILGTLILRVPYPKVTRDYMGIVLSGFYSDNETTLCIEVNNGIIYEGASSNSDLKGANIRIVASAVKNGLTKVDL